MTIDYNSKAYAFGSYFDHLLFDTVKKYLKPEAKDRILEIGCNRGALVGAFQNDGFDAVGIDINWQAITHGVVKDLQTMDATALEFPEESFDRIYSLHTIEHIENMQKTISEMDRVLKFGGRIVLIYPAEPGFLRGMLALKSAIVVYRNPFLIRKIHVHSVTPKTIERLIENTSLKHVESHFPVLYYPQYVTVLEKRIIEKHYGL